MNRMRAILVLAVLVSGCGRAPTWRAEAFSDDLWPKTRRQGTQGLTTWPDVFCWARDGAGVVWYWRLEQGGCRSWPAFKTPTPIYEDMPPLVSPTTHAGQAS